MKTVLKGLIVGSVAVLGFGCASASEAACAKSAECATLGSKTEAQCATDAQKQIDDWRAKPDCVTLADKSEAFAECASGLTCEQAKFDALATGPCKSQFEDFFGAALANLEKCPANP